MRRILALFLLFMLSLFTGQAQEKRLSALSKISVLTCGPGGEIYSAFGHSAFRVWDPALGIDVVYNYGIFDFNAGHFYLNYALGHMDYQLGREPFNLFLRQYDYEGRWVKEQVLHLNQGQRNRLFTYLEWNAKPENRVYRYDYFRNNCSTKIWDVLKTNFGDTLQFNPGYVQDRKSIRRLIHEYVDPDSWSALGIDLALGSRIDVATTPEQHLFLPEYVQRQLQTAHFGAGPAANDPVTLLQGRPLPASLWYQRPLFWAVVVLVLILVLTYRDVKRGLRSRYSDLLLFSVNGMAGLLLCFLWFFTDHIDAAYNYNVLWALALNIIIAFWVVKRVPPPWMGHYITLLLALIGLVLILGALDVQSFSATIQCLISLLAVRYAYLYILWVRKWKGSEPAP